MKTLYTVLLIVLFSSISYACSFLTTPFCQIPSSGTTLIYGRVADTIPHGIKLEVFWVYRGTVMNDTVTIWDSKFWCMDTTELPARQIGNIGDSVFVDVPYIDSIANPWEVIGDYRMDNFYERTSFLRVQGDSVYGYIAGYQGAPIEYQTYVYGLESFKAWLEADETCATIVSINEPSALDLLTVYPNPTTDYIAINNLPMNATLEILSIDGQHVSEVILYESRISTTHLAAGSYLLKISHQGEMGYKRIVKL